MKIREGFDSEESLVAATLSCIRRSENRSFKVQLEVDAGVGFADIVLYRRQSQTTRELQLLAKIPPRLAPLLDASISQGISSRDDFAHLLGLSESAAERVISKLHKIGLLKIGAAGISLASVKRPPFQTIIAVEAKLSDWSRALVQAYRNRQFADESWVVLDHRFYRPAIAQLERFQRSEVGLASVDVEKNLYIHYKAPIAPAINSTKRWHAQAELARRLSLRTCS